ncbi:BTB/POZ domain-containing protein 16-like [Rhopilema esculentum]|uniref:BTB/POZ domain-containing protein 16-like n=1 Tax=Rhopilema esculentum TaxID=499914 RepID=UPI0031DFA647
MSSTQNNVTSAHPYLPSFPPSKGTKPSYSRFLVSAPLIALADITPHSKKPQEFKSSTGCRVRVQVGNTNRWRATAALGSDLLGTSQAMKAMQSSKQGEGRSTSKGEIRTFCGNSDVLHNFYSNKMSRMRHGLHSAPPLSNMNSYKASGAHVETRCKTSGETRSKRISRNMEDIKDELLSLKHVYQLQMHCDYVPPESRRPTPIEVFLRNVHLASRNCGIELIINALNTNWNLHLRFAEGSRLLSDLIKDKKSVETSQSSPQEDYDDDFFVTSDRQGVAVSIPRRDPHPTIIPIFLDLEVTDELITRHAFATALCFLYDDEVKIETLDVINVLAAARFLRINPLVNRCIDLMITNVDSRNACIFHRAAVKYDVPAVQKYCENWLQLNAIPQLSSSFALAHLSSSLLEKLLKSHNLFLCNEYQVYKLLCNWVFCKQHPTLQMLPSWGTVVTWFMSIPITVSFLESDEGRRFHSLFENLRLKGITNPGQLDEISKMNIFPSDWLLKVFSSHFYSLQGGGDMSLLTRFEDGAIRYGFMIDEPNFVQSEIISLHGFHFDIFAEFDDDGQCHIFIQRLKPTDPFVSKRISDRQTFSVRYDREVRYAIKAQYVDGESFFIKSLGPKSQCFGLNNKSERSEILKIATPILPLYVTISLLFPPS